MEGLISWPLKFIVLFLEWLQIRIDKYMVYAWNMSLTVGPGFSSPIKILLPNYLGIFLQRKKKITFLLNLNWSFISIDFFEKSIEIKLRHEIHTVKLRIII